MLVKQVFHTNVDKSIELRNSPQSMENQWNSPDKVKPLSWQLHSTNLQWQDWTWFGNYQRHLLFFQVPAAQARDQMSSNFLDWSHDQWLKNVFLW